MFHTPIRLPSGPGFPLISLSCFRAQGLVAALIAFVFIHAANAAFDPNCDGRVFAIAVQEDGKIIIGGEFSTVGGAPHGSIARLNADGTVDDTFQASVDHVVAAVALQADGKILAGGNLDVVGN